MSETQPAPYPRIGNTLRELEGWTTDFADDQTLQAEADFIKGQVLDWEYGKPTVDVLRALYRRYRETDGQVSEAASTVLMQSSMWFGYEANVPTEKNMEIMNEELRTDMSEISQESPVPLLSLDEVQRARAIAASVEKIMAIINTGQKESKGEVMVDLDDGRQTAVPYFFKIGEPTEGVNNG